MGLRRPGRAPHDETPRQASARRGLTEPGVASRLSLLSATPKGSDSRIAGPRAGNAGCGVGWPTARRLQHGVFGRWPLAKRLRHGVFGRWPMARRFRHGVFGRWPMARRLRHGVFGRWPMARMLPPGLPADFSPFDGFSSAAGGFSVDRRVPERSATDFRRWACSERSGADSPRIGAFRGVAGGFSADRRFRTEPCRPEEPFGRCRHAHHQVTSQYSTGADRAFGLSGVGAPRASREQAHPRVSVSTQRDIRIALGAPAGYAPAP